jgi:hypothetical protein
VNIRQIINTVANLSNGMDEASASDIPAYLENVNLAHSELYTLIYSFNLPAFLKKVVIQSDAATINDVLFVYSVAIDGQPKPLKKAFYHELILTDPSLSKVGSPSEYYCTESANTWTFGLYPASDVPVSLIVHYVPQPVDLKLDDEEAAIPYPRMWHNLLVDGAIYYAIQADEGFNSTVDIKIYTSRWEKAKSQFLANRLANKNRSIRTFSNV